METDKSIKIFTIIFLLLLTGFIGFLFIQANNDTERDEQYNKRFNRSRLK